jgi:hypothetical protein
MSLSGDLVSSDRFNQQVCPPIERGGGWRQARAFNADERERGNRRYIPPGPGYVPALAVVIAEARRPRSSVRGRGNRGVGCFGFLRDRAVCDPLAGAKTMREAEKWRSRGRIPHAVVCAGQVYRVGPNSWLYKGPWSPSDNRGSRLSRYQVDLHPLIAYI